MRRYLLTFIIALSFTFILYSQDVIVKKNANTDPVIEINSAGNNSFIGKESGGSNTGTRNTTFGWRSLYTNSTGSNNVALGANTLQLNTTGNQNIGIGRFALNQNTNRNSLVAIGDSALYYNGTSATLAEHATWNTAIG